MDEAEISNPVLVSGKDVNDVEEPQQGEDDKFEVDAEISSDDMEDESEPSNLQIKSNVDIRVNPPEEYDNESDPSDIYDQSYLSDEETSSLAGSFDEYGISEKDEDSGTSDQQIVGMNREEKLRRHAVRRHLDQLGDLVIEREYIVQKTREQLLKCRGQIEELEKCLEEVQEQTEEEDSKGNKAAYYRLKSQYEKLSTELQIEKDVERNTLQTLEDAEFALCQAYIEHGKFLPLDEEFANDEKALEKQKADKNAARLKKETAAVMNAERKRRTRERENLSNMRERERKTRQAVIAAKKNRELAMKYLKETMTRVRQRESEEEEKNRIELQNRMQALLSLKSNIEGNRENLHALQARDAHLRRQDDKVSEQERNEIIATGLHPDEVLTRRKRLRQFERDKEAFERKQREREIEIVDKIISEEKQVKRRQQQQPQLWPDRQSNRVKRLTRRKPKPRFARSSGSESMEYGADVEDTGGRVSSYNNRLGSRLSKLSSDDDDFSPYGATSRDEAKTGESEEDVLVVPDFKGLWEADQSEAQDAEMTNWKTEHHEYTTYEQQMMADALEKQKENIVQKQVAAGKEFKGAAFYSKPDVLVFKDLDVGKTYKKKVLLTNVSYAQNYCKYIGVSDNLKDFLEIQFDPPGPMSAGLTCEFIATFTPMLDIDITGKVDFLAQTGSFSVTVNCLKKRCELNVDSTEVNFETQVVGETRRKTITLTNNGALSTEFEFVRVTGAEVKQSVSEPMSIGGGSAVDEVQVTSRPATQLRATCKSPAKGKNSKDAKDELRPVSVSPVKSTRTTSGLQSSQFEDGMVVGQSSKGVIGPFSSVKLEIIFSPLHPANVNCLFRVTFTDEESPEIDVVALGQAIAVPVWVEREIVDMKICMFDRLYQDAIIVNNRATSALRLTFQFPKDLRDYIDILPKTAYIQAESSFSAQLKFLPRSTLLTDAHSYCDEKTGSFNAPIIIRVADQTRPVPFSLRAVVTSSDFEFDTKEVNFGYCTVYESVKKTVVLRNKSVLSQAYGFVSAPEAIDVQPNDGFGTLLPEESLEIDIFFSPKKAKEYNFELICKSGIGREFKLFCKAIGVLPPLSISQSLIKFKATAINDSSTAQIFVYNNHLSSNEFTHPVPRIGNGPIFPVGPTSFEFIVPDGIPISISPTVGTVKPGEKFMVLVTFSPKLDPNKVNEEAVRILERLEEIESKNTEVLMAQQIKENSKSKIKGRKEQKSAKRGSTGQRAHSGQKGSPAPRVHSSLSPRSKSNNSNRSNFSIDDVVIGSDAYESGQMSLLKTYEDTFAGFKIPCFMAYGECGDPGQLEYSNYYTLYLEIHCPCVKPSLLVISDKGRSLIDFGNVATGQKCFRVVSLQNISDEPIALTSSALDPIGPFEIVNALRTLQPDKIHSMKIAFSPSEASEPYEVLKVGCEKSSITLRLKGKGVSPSIELSCENNILDIGDALVADVISTTLKLKNTSELALEVEMKLGSLFPSKHARTQQAWEDVDSLQDLPASNAFIIGTGNLNGMCPFDCQPYRCNIKPGETQEFSVSFAPDHASENFADELCININGDAESHRIRLLARAWSNMTYLRGWDRLKPLEESHVATFEQEEVDVADAKSIQRTVLLTFRCHLIKNEFTESIRHVDIGCIKANTQTKKSCDFYFESFKEANDLGFSFDPTKGGVDIGVRKVLTFRWKPPNEHDPNAPAHSSITLMAKGDVTLQYKILLRGYVVTHDEKNN